MPPDTKDIKAEHRAAIDAMRRGDFRQAHQHCLTVLRADNKHADAWFLCGVIAGQNGQLEKAEEIFHRAITLAPSNPEYLAELGKNLTAQLQPAEALAVAQRAMQLNPAATAVLNTLGTVFSFSGEHQQALSCYKKATAALQDGNRGPADAPLAGELYFNLGSSLQFAGDFDDAEAAYEKALELKPSMFRAHSAIASLRRQTDTHNHLQRLEQQKPNIRNGRDQLHLGHAIAKEKEDLGFYRESLEALTWGKATHARQVGYRKEADAEIFAGLRELFSGPALAAARDNSPGCASQEPIFIVGMPRTGTTLVEQVLGSHSSVYPAGELPNFPQQLRRLTGSKSIETPELDMLRKAARLDMQELGQSYIDSTRPRTGHTPRFTDKLPLNFKHLGLISLALPRAKLVCLRRDPMDTCLSNFRQIFALDFRQYHYSLSLLDCAAYYIEFDRLMQHWHAVMPGRVHEVQYEKLVNEPEATTRELLAYCELPWEADCLTFHQRPGSVATPSAVQVRQGIYTSSVGRWRRYGEGLQPLHELLSSAGLYG